jgi:excisionase family DNA binding protein
MPDPMTPDDVAAKLGVSRAKVLRWIRAGELAHIRISQKLIYIRPEQLEAFLAARAVPTRSQADIRRRLLKK